MGGGQKVQQTNPGQAAAANAGATNAANTAAGQGGTFSAQQQQLYQMLYGTPGSGGSGGALSSMLNPSNLNVTSPTGVFALQNTNANNAAASQYAQNSQNINSQLAQSGFNPASTPAGFGAQLQQQNAQALANTKGQNFTNATNSQYQTALSNFWNAANATSSNMNATGSQANTAQGTAANTYANLYGTAGHGNVTQSPNYLSPILGAAGTMGSAALGPGGAATQAVSCCAEGTLIRTGPNEFTLIEKLWEGAEIFGARENDDDPAVLKHRPQFAIKPCVRIVTDGGQELICSTDHTLPLPVRGYVTAEESLGASVCTREAVVTVTKVEHVGEHRVVRLRLATPHVFESNGLLSEE